MIDIRVEGLVKSFDLEKKILDGLTFQVDTGERVGLLGRNGAGKTTLFKILTGELDYDSGTVQIASGRRVGLISQIPVYPEGYTVEDVLRTAFARMFRMKDEMDALTLAMEQGASDDATLRRYGELNARFEGLGGWDTDTAVNKVANGLSISDEMRTRLFDRLSGGEKTRVNLGRLILEDTDVLLLDEPTNHLDLEGRRVVSRYLSRKSGFLLVSHDRVFLDGCVDHIMVINKRDIEVRQGSFSAWWRDKQARDDWERAENARLKREIGRLEDAARRTASWSDRVEAAKKGCRNSGLRPDRGYLGHKAQKMMRRSKAVEARRTEAAEAKAGLLKNIELAEALKLRPLEHPKRCLLEARELAPDYGAGPVCRPVSFTVERGERVALVGRNGSGKSSLLRLALGEEIPHTGLFSLASGLVVSYVPQDASFLRGSLSQFARRYELDETQFKTILRKLDFARVQFEKDLSDYSAGQKKKVLLARSLCQSAHLYVWDEPLNYIDVFSRMQLEELLRACRPAMLLVEHDQAFLEGLADKRVKLVPA